MSSSPPTSTDNLRQSATKQECRTLLSSRTLGAFLTFPSAHRPEAGGSRRRESEMRVRESGANSAGLGTVSRRQGLPIGLARAEYTDAAGIMSSRSRRLCTGAGSIRKFRLERYVTWQKRLRGWVDLILFPSFRALLLPVAGGGCVIAVPIGSSPISDCRRRASSDSSHPAVRPAGERGHRAFSCRRVCSLCDGRRESRWEGLYPSSDCKIGIAAETEMNENQRRRKEGDG